MKDEKEYLYINEDLRIERASNCYTLQAHVVNEYVKNKDTKEIAVSDKWVDLSYHRNPYLCLKRVLDLEFDCDLAKYVDRLEKCYDKIEKFITQFKDELHEM